MPRLQPDASSRLQPYVCCRLQPYVCCRLQPCVLQVDMSEGDSRYILVFSPHCGCLNHSPDDPDEFTEIEPGTTGTLALVRKQARLTCLTT